MRILILLFIIAISACTTSNSSRLSKVEEVKQSAILLNKNSLQTLGISLKAMQFLLGAHKQSFLPIPYHQQNLKYFRELESAGYINIVTSTQQFPGESNPIEVAQLIPTEIGQSVIDAIAK